MTDHLDLTDRQRIHCLGLEARVHELRAQLAGEDPRQMITAIQAAAPALRGKNHQAKMGTAR